MCRYSSIKLHGQMLNSILKTKLNFFIQNTIGDIENRFSNDIRTVDNDLAATLFNFIQVFFSSLFINIKIVVLFK